MAIVGFTEILNTIYIAKKLHAIDKYSFAESCFSDILDYDMYFSNMYELIQNLFLHYYCRYYENREFEIHILSDPVIVDFYILAGRYGKRENILENDNPYIKAANQEVRDNLDISHCLDWMLMGHTEPKRPFHSRLGLFISYDCNCLSFGVLAYRLIVLYEWFKDKCVELKTILDDTMGGLQMSLFEEEVVA